MKHGRLAGIVFSHKTAEIGERDLHVLERPKVLDFQTAELQRFPQTQIINSRAILPPFQVT